MPRGRQPGAKNFTDAECRQLLATIDRLQPGSPEEWARAFDEYNLWARQMGYKERPHDGLKKQYNRRANGPGPVGEPYETWDVRRAKAIERKKSSGGASEGIPPLPTPTSTQAGGMALAHAPLGVVAEVDMRTPSPSGPSVRVSPHEQDPPHLRPPLRPLLPAHTPTSHAGIATTAQQPLYGTSAQDGDPVRQLLLVQNEKLEARNERLEQRISGLEKGPTGLQEMLMGQNERLAARNEKLEEKIDKLESRNRELEKECSNLKAELTVAKGGRWMGDDGDAEMEGEPDGSGEVE